MAKEFKSRTFRFGFPEGEHFNAFKDDIDLTRKIDISKVDELIPFLKKLISANNKKEKNKVIDEIIEQKLIEDYPIVYSFHRVSKYFFDKFTEDDTEKDTPEDITWDISKRLEIDEAELAAIQKLLVSIKKNSEWYKQKELKEIFEKGLFPNIKSIGTTVELRGVFNREIKYGEKIEEYSDILEIEEKNPVIPTISVAISLDSGTPERFCFQDSPENIEWLINKLQAALLKTKKLKDKYNLK